MRIMLLFVAAIVPVSASCAQSWQSAPIFPALEDHPAAERDRPGKPCLAPPEPIHDFASVSKYGQGNKTNSTVIDPESAAQYDRDIEPIENFAKEIVKRANHYIEGRNTALADAKCALDWLDEWARGDALLGELNSQGVSIRKWELATFATTLLKIDDAPLDEAKKDRVKAWIHQLALAAKEDYSTKLRLKSRQNNHLYWAGWGVAAAGIATHDRELFDWGIARYRDGVDDIRDDGVLPLELERRTRAAGYHMFALQPLIMLAEAGEANGIDMYGYKEHRLQKLIDLNLAALDDLDAIGKLNGYEQKDLYTETALSWMEPYYARFHDERVRPWLDKHRPMGSRRTGGNMTALYFPFEQEHR